MKRIRIIIAAILCVLFANNMFVIQAASAKVMTVSTENIVIDSQQTGTVIVSLSDEALMSGNQIIYCQAIDASQEICYVAWGNSTSRNSLPLIIIPRNNGTTQFRLSNTFNDEEIILTVAVRDMTSGINDVDLQKDLSNDENFNYQEELPDGIEAIETVEDLENYLNDNWNSCQTPMGEFKYEFSITKNDNRLFPYDFWIKTEHRGVYPWYNLEYSISLSDTDKKSTLSILRNFQLQIYKIASAAFPDAKIMGGFYDGHYKYPHVKVGYYSIRSLSWKNFDRVGIGDYYSSYITEFQWDTTVDDYVFNEQ